jgi:hypothetical protein
MWFSLDKLVTASEARQSPPLTGRLPLCGGNDKMNSSFGGLASAFSHGKSPRKHQF